MATVVLYPASNGSPLSWSILVGAASKWQACLTNDGDTSYSGAVWTDGAAVLGLFNMDALPAGVGAISDVTVTVIVRRNNASLANIRPAMKLSGGSVQYSGSNFTSSTSYVSISYSFGGGYSVAQINAAQFGAELGTNSWSTYCTQVYVTVTFDWVPTPFIGLGFGQSVFSSTVSWTDVATDLTSLDIKRGRQHEIDRIEAGTAVITLNNASGNYWRNNTSGAYTPNVKPLTPMEITATYGTTSYSLFYGYTESFEPGWVEERGGKSPIMTIQCVDVFKSFTRYSLVGSSTGATLYATTATALRVGQVLSTIGFPTTNYYYTPSTVNGLPVAGLIPPAGGTNAMEHLQDCSIAEAGTLFMRGDGYVTFQLKNYRRTVTSSATFSSSSMLYAYPEFIDDETFIYNQAYITANPSTGAGVEQEYHATASTITEQGERAMVRTDTILQLDYDAFDQAYTIVKRYDHSAFRCQSLLVLPDADPTNLYPKVFGYDIGTKITLQLNNTTNPASINSDYHIEGIEHHWDAKTNLWQTKWQLWGTNQYYRLIDAHDGWLGRESAVSYVDAQSGVETSNFVNIGNGLNNSTGSVSVGQGWIVLNTYDVYRGIVKVDTTGLGVSTNTIIGADLVLHTATTTVTTDVSFGIYAVSASTVNQPLISTDYGIVGGSLTPLASSSVNFVAGSAYNNAYITLTFNTTGIDTLNSWSGGVYNFGLRSSDDISARTPSTANQYVTFQGGGQYGFTSTSIPQLFLRLA